MNKPKQPGREILPLLLIFVGFLMVAGVFFYALTSVGKNPPAANAAGDIPYPDMKRVTLADAKAAFDNHSGVFVDVRDAVYYKEGHIPGAVNIPLNELENRAGELDPAQWIITYCTWPAEQSSARGAEILSSKGFKHVDPILGGFEAWETAGYPVQK